MPNLNAQDADTNTLTDLVLHTAVKGSLEIFAKGYQYSNSPREQLSTDVVVMKFLQETFKDTEEQDRYFNMYKEMRK